MTYNVGTSKWQSGLCAGDILGFCLTWDRNLLKHVLPSFAAAGVKLFQGFQDLDSCTVRKTTSVS